LLGARPFAEEGNACTKLLAIAGTIVSATADRQFANGTQVHIATGGSDRQLPGVRDFLHRKMRDVLPKLREALHDPKRKTAPPYWIWDPYSFTLEGKQAGSPTLFREIINAGRPALQKNEHGNEVTVADALRDFRNALSHGNVWLLAGEDFPADDPRHCAEGRIVGFALATTTPRYESHDAGGKRRFASIEDRFKVKGLMLSPLDLRAIVEGWANVLKTGGLSRGEGGRLISEAAAD